MTAPELRRLFVVQQAEPRVGREHKLGMMVYAGLPGSVDEGAPTTLLRFQASNAAPLGWHGLRRQVRACAPAHPWLTALTRPRRPPPPRTSSGLWLLKRAAGQNLLRQPLALPAPSLPAGFREDALR
jgi:hypothetical protein